MDYRELAPSLQCGDIFLFHGTTPVSVLISAITHSPFSHVAMVYRLPGSQGSDGLRLWQAFEPEGGIVDDDLAGFLAKYIATEPGATLTCRRLSPAVTPAMAEAFAAFMAKVKGAKFPDYIPWIVGYLSACLGIANSDGTCDCAQFVAESYMAARLLKTWPLSRVYAPGRFAADTYELQLQLGRGFGPEIAVTITGSGAMTTVPSAAIDPIPAHAYPVLTTVAAPPPVMPPAWSAKVLLHPFGPPPSEGPVPDTPYYAMRIATIDYAAGQYLSARVGGCPHGWWYVVTPAGTRLSIDGGASWSAIDCGWSLPGDWYGAQAATAACAGASPLNWLAKAPVEWWRLQVPLPAPSPPGATWLWFDAVTRLPVRMMFGVSPPAPAMGDPAQLAFFQQFSLSYFADFTVHAVAPPLPTSFGDTGIAGLAEGNPLGYKPFVWNSNFGLTSFSTPVNGLFNPLATRTLYVWQDDAHYRTYTDRAQSTLMHYTYNPVQPAGSKPIDTVTSLLTGVAPRPGVTYAGTGFLYTHYRDGSDGCITGAQFEFGQEPPWWLSIKGVGGTLVATITDHPVLAPGGIVTVWSVLFPPNDKYPDGIYLWTWYAPDPHGDGTASRPILFMQSDSGVGEGTSLALADYFYYANFAAPIDPANFTVPAVCASAAAAAAPAAAPAAAAPAAG